MRRISLGLLASLLLASACGPAPAGKDARKPAARATASAGAPAKAAPSGATRDPARLRSAPGTVPLGGTIRVDAAYMVAAGAGNVLSHNGGQIVAAGGGNILSHNGGQLVAAGGLDLVAAGGLGLVAAGAGNLVAAGGGNLVAAGAGNIVAAGGGNLVAAGAGNLVGPDGASVVGHNGGGIVAAGAGNMVAAGAGNLVAAGAGNLVGPDGASYLLPLGAYALAQTTPALPFGTQLPAAGMLVWVKSLETGNPVPLGEGPDGKPVWAVFTDAAGRYDVHVPEAQRATVMVVAEAPFRNDRRTGYGVLAAPRDASPAIDEDKALVTRYLRLAARTRFDHFMLPFIKNVGLDDEHALAAIFGQVGPDEKPVLAPELQAVLLPRIRELHGALAANPKIATDADYRFVFEEMADVLLSDAGAYGVMASQPVDVEAYVAKVLDPEADPEDAAIVAALRQDPLYRAAMAPDGPGRLSALGVLERVMGEVRRAVETMGAAEAKAFAARNPFVAGANAFHAKYDPPAIPRPYYTFAKATDLAEFVVTEYLAHPINAPYGCRGGDCDAAWTRGAAEPACHPDSLPEPCLPAVGVRELRTAHLRRMLRSVLEDAALPPAYADLLYAAGEAVATSSVTQIVTLQPQLLHVICRYGQGPAPACPLP